VGIGGFFLSPLASSIPLQPDHLYGVFSSGEISHPLEVVREKKLMQK